MALEDKIEALTAALNRNSDLLEGLTAKAAAGAAKVTSADSSKETEAPKRGRSAKAETEAPKKAKAPTSDEMADATKKFLEVDDEDEYVKRRALVKRIIAKHEVAKMSEIAESKRQGALDALTAYKAGEATEYDEEEEDIA